MGKHHGALHWGGFLEKGIVAVDAHRQEMNPCPLVQEWVGRIDIFELPGEHRRFEDGLCARGAPAPQGHRQQHRDGDDSHGTTLIPIEVGCHPHSAVSEPRNREDRTRRSRECQSRPLCVGALCKNARQRPLPLVPDDDDEPSCRAADSCGPHATCFSLGDTSSPRRDNSKR